MFGQQLTPHHCTDLNSTAQHTATQHNTGQKAHLPMVQHSEGSAMHETLHSPAHLQLVLIGLPPQRPCALGCIPCRQLSYLSNNLLLLLTLQCMLPPASKGFSQNSVQHALQADHHLLPMK